MEINPRVVFERMFGGAGTVGRAARPHAHAPQHPRFGVRSRRRGSSRVSGRATRRGSSDYLENIREIERRIERSEQHERRADLPVPDAPVGAPEVFEEHVA